MTAIQANAPQQSLAAAQSRFKQAVSQGIVQLMQQCGYSRERATAALLRELGRGDVSPDTNEVLDAMSSFGLGVDDASHAFTVSRAVRRAMKERGLSAVEAIDDLSSKLNISNLVTSSPSEELVDDDQTLVSTSRPSSPAQQQRTAPAPTPATADRISTQQQHRKRKASAKTNHKNTKQKKTLSRKRPAPSSNDEKKFSSSRERADSVTEAVEAKAKKARRSSPEDSPSPEAPSDASIIVRSKRNASNLTRDEQPQSSTP